MDAVFKVRVWVNATFMLLSLLVFEGCIFNNNPYYSNDHPGNILIFINSDSSGTTRIQTTQSYWNYNSFEVVSYDLKDTLILPVREFDLVRILNPTIDLDSVIVRAGDTLYLDILKEGYVRRHYRDGQLLDAAESANPFETSNPHSTMIDSLQNLFFYVDYNWPFEFNLDNTKYINYPIIPISENIENKPEVMRTYIELMFEDFHKRFHDKPSEMPLALHQLEAEIRLSKIMTNIRFLHRQKPYDFLRNGIFSDIFLSYREPETVSLSFISQQINVLEQRVTTKNDLLEFMLDVYDNASDYWPEKILEEYARYFVLSKLIESAFDDKLLTKKIEAYTDKYTNSKWVEVLNDFQNTQIIKKDFLLTSKDSLFYRFGKSTTFPDFIKEHKGKSIFVDFWASWCAPCLRALPDIISLKNEMNNDEILFVFISIDENKDAWRKADERLFPDGYKYSFISPGFNGSILQKELNIQQIPRYVLFDKKGRMLLNQSGLAVKEISSTLRKL